MSTPEGRPPRVVAELGRPETPEETAARKAESSRRHRSNQTLRNLVLALLASLAIVLFLVLVVVRPTQPDRTPVAYDTVASEAQPQVKNTLVAPDLPDSWTANAAGLNTGADDVAAWSIGFITPANQFISFTQGIDANVTWVSNQLEKARSTGSAAVGGLDWKVYDRRDKEDTGNFAYSMTTTVGTNSVVLHGTAATKEFRVLAQAVASQLRNTDGSGK
ncbi:DUF4245 domain-containing protein [Glaciihabitans sp. UYNi722]|uniref:DUF4245 domain-containing protein n=1 Tax=Glaciihabitans sp. UYNi722 TaxID=3156344 RepID=UPI0033987B2B